MVDGNVKLDRTLGLGSVVLFGLAYMAPMIVLGTFGTLATASRGTTAMSYLIAAAAIFLTAMSYCVMSRVHPVAGSAYSYARRAIGPGIGFLVGWAVLLDYIFLPMVIWLIGAAYLAFAFPGVPGGVWIIGFIVLTSAINIVGIACANRVNIVLMLVQMAVLAAFLGLAARYVLLLNGPGGLVSVTPFFTAGVPFSASVAGAAIAAYSFLGFDAVTTLAEETRDARRIMPKAILVIALGSGLIFVLSAYLAQLAHPGAAFASTDAAAAEVARAIGGDLFVTVFLATLVVAQFTSGLAAQASVGRLLYAMGRDRVLPPAFFGRLHPRWLTPALNLLLVGGIGLAALAMDVATSASFINFGAFLGFATVNLSVIALYLKGDRRIRALGALAGVVVPALGAVCDIVLLWHLDRHARLLGLAWLALGVAYLGCRTRGFRRTPPDMEFAG
ncbi:APC family permease [Gluconacetobacter azotocaptans]|uniref:APC family permease n=1 Tax=Gluconacetobacter azotocaptans TaxID=142834 RepID=UPI001959695C|nr:APC family permease [Gluconacetobacter azotocaptans]GBQ32447.1 amino acid permease [Gluconacetobacter azotocaptans DSM 13594]